MAQTQTHDLDLAGAPSMEGIQLQRGTGKFENVQGCPVLLAKACRAPYGVEVESKFTPRPVFAGGNDPRKWLAVQVEVPPSVATALDTLDGALSVLSDSPGTWSSRGEPRWALLCEGARQRGGATVLEYEGRRRPAAGDSLGGTQHGTRIAQQLPRR